MEITKGQYTPPKKEVFQKRKQPKKEKKENSKTNSAGQPLRDVGVVVNEEEKQQKRIQNVKIYGIVAGVFFTWFLCLGLGGAVEDGKGASEMISYALDRITSGAIIPPLNSGSFAGIFLGAIASVGITLYMLDRTKMNEHYDPEAEVDTGGFMSNEDIEKFRKEVMAPEPEPQISDKVIPYDPEHDKEMYSQNMIMSNRFSRPMKTRKLKGNNNVCVIGGSGMGKSRFFIKPNILQMNASFVITDPSGEMVFAMGNVLLNHGYKIKIFNLTDMKYSNTYNPLNYIRDEAGVKMVVECLIENTSGKGKKGDEFFENAEKLLYSACIFYLLDFCQDAGKKNFAHVMDMINASKVDENNSKTESEVDKLFNQLPVDSLAYKYYRAFKQAAGKTLMSILISCVTRLQPFLIPQVINLTSSDTLDLGKLGEEKTALFIITPQADNTYSFLATMLYSQLFETLYYQGEQKKLNTGSEELTIPVRCLMDEFANTAGIPEFDKKLATMRKYNISATIMLQGLAQLKTLFKDEWPSILSNCSTVVNLGTNEPDTIEYVMKQLGEKTIRTKSENLNKSGSSQGYSRKGRSVMTAFELSTMPDDECIVLTTGHRPVRDKKYEYMNHPYYPYTGDCNKEYGFNYKKLSVYNNGKASKLSSIIKARASAKAYTDRQKRRIEEEITRRNTARKDPYDALDSFVFSDEEERKAYKLYAQECISRVISQDFTKYPCVVMLNDLPRKWLQPIAEQVCRQLSLPSIAIFSNLTEMTKLEYHTGVLFYAEGRIDSSDRRFSNPYILEKSRHETGAVIIVKRSEYQNYINAVRKDRKN